ncbi:MAG: galactose mutarotase [Sphingobacteriales bacterium]|nr:galactose mutarotase [Sphingobacteriales bacterium]
MGVSISSKLWGKYKGEDIYLFKMENSNGAFVELTNYGATVVSIVVPDKNNKLGNVVLGFPTLQGYLDDQCYLGSTIGRFANRIAKARFSLDGIEYQLEPNDNDNSNHSASAGFNSKVFDFSVDEEKVSFSMLSKDGEGGYPGNLQFSVHYKWTDDNKLLINYTAETDQKTVVSFTNHCYFNLTAGTDTIFDHELTIKANQIVEADSDYIPTGNIVPADDTSFQNTKIHQRLQKKGADINGLNVCYVLNKDEVQSGEPAAVLKDPHSARTLSIYTTFPGVMLYTGDYLNSIHKGHLGKTYKPFDGLCLECQYFPDSPNHSNFPSTILNSGEIYDECITLEFNVES